MSQPLAGSHDINHDAQSIAITPQHSTNPIPLDTPSYGAQEPDPTSTSAEHNNSPRRNNKRTSSPTIHRSSTIQPPSIPNANAPLPSIETDIKDENVITHQAPETNSSSQPETQPPLAPHLNNMARRHASLGPEYNSQLPIPTKRIISLRQDQVQRRAAVTFGSKPHSVSVKAIALPKVDTEGVDGAEAIVGGGLDVPRSRSLGFGFIEEERPQKQRKGLKNGSRVFEIDDVDDDDDDEAAMVSRRPDNSADVMVVADAQHPNAAGSDLNGGGNGVDERAARGRSIEGVDLTGIPQGPQGVGTALSRPTGPFNRHPGYDILLPPPPPQQRITTTTTLPDTPNAPANQPTSTFSAPSFNPSITTPTNNATTAMTTLPTHTHTHPINPPVNLPVKHDPSPPPPFTTSPSQSLTPLPPFSPNDLLNRFETQMSTFHAEEQKLMEEWEWWHAAFAAWAATSRHSDEQRGAKRLRTRVRKVGIEEEGVEGLRGRMTKVVEAFESALAMMGD